MCIEACNWQALLQAIMSLYGAPLFVWATQVIMSRSFLASDH